MNRDRRAQETVRGDQRPASARRGDGPDPRLVALVRLLARHSARQDHDQALRDATNGGNSEGTAPEIEP